MNTRILAFPLMVAAIVTVDACEGVNPNDPSVKVCHDDTTYVPVRWSDGRVDSAMAIWHADTTKCRKAAA